MQVVRKLNCPNIHFGTYEDIEFNEYNLEDFTVIFAGDKKISEKEISMYAENLLKAGCRSFGFCSRYGNIWHFLFDAKGLSIYMEPDDVALTHDIESIEDIPDELCICEENVFIYTDTCSTMRKCHKAIVDAGCGIRVKYTGPEYPEAFDKEKEYAVLSIEDGWYRIMTERNTDQLLPLEMIEITRTGESGIYL